VLNDKKKKERKKECTYGIFDHFDCPTIEKQDGEPLFSTKDCTCWMGDDKMLMPELR
jgi:hypothetical protein